MVVLRVRKNKAGLLLAAASVGLYAAVGQLARGPDDTVGWLLGYATAWALYLALFVVQDPDEWVASPWLLLLWAALARLVLAGSTPWLSDDLYRYLLDGRVFAAGINPFRYAPSSPVITVLAPELVAKVNHPDIPTIYPPLVQLVGLLAAWAHLGVVGWRVLMSGIDLAVMLGVSRLFGGGVQGWRAAAVYGLCPLAVWECGANGHLEPLLALPMVLALWALRRRRPGWAGLAMGAAALVKYFPLLLLPLWLRERGFWKLLLLALGLTALGLWPFARAGVDIFAGLRAYLENWSFNSPLHSALAMLLGDTTWLRAMPFAVVAVAGLVAALHREEPLRMVPMLLFAFLVIGPTLHPWYALWVLPWLGDRPHMGLWAFVAAMGGAYSVWWQVAHTGVWELPHGVAEVLWSIVALGWLVALTRDEGSTPEMA